MKKFINLHEDSLWDRQQGGYADEWMNEPSLLWTLHMIIHQIKYPR